MNPLHKIKHWFSKKRNKSFLSNSNIKNKRSIKKQIDGGKDPIKVNYKNHDIWVNNEDAAIYHLENSIEKIEKLAISSLERIPKGRSSELVCVDVGANTGLFSYFIKYYEPRTKIYLIEPDSTLIPCIKLNLRGFENIQIFNFGLSDVTSTEKFFINPASRQTNSFEYNAVAPFSKLIHEKEVNVTTLDIFFKKNNIKFCDLIKIDVQGYESKILKGGQDSFNKISLLALEASFVSTDTIESLMLASKFFNKYLPINSVLFGADLIFYND